MTKLSVVIPTHNRVDRLKRVLARLEHQTYPLADFEVIVVSDGSTDGTNEYLRTTETPLQLIPVVQSNQGPAVARNTGFAQASGDIVLFIDDDVVPVPELIAEHASWHETNGREVVVLGPMLTPPDFKMTPWVQWEQAMLVKQYQAMINGLWQPTARQFFTGNSSLAREHLLTVGGFDAAFRRAEDLELAYRLAGKGLRFVFNSQAIGYHYAERTFASWMAIPYAYGRSDVIFTYRKGQAWLLPQVLREFRRRHFLIRSITWLSLERPRLSRLSIAAMKLVIEKGRPSNRAYLTNIACSSIFNMRYYQGVADELGGRRAFLAAAVRARAEGQHSGRRAKRKSSIALTRER